MKKILVGALSAALVLGIGTAVFAAGNDLDKAKESHSFDQMKSFMEKMHPEFSNEELKAMYDSCHGENGKMQGKHMENMDNKYHAGMTNQF